MWFGSIFKKAILMACYAFSVIILLYSLIVITFMEGMGLEPWSVFLFFPLSFGFSLANGIVRCVSLKNGLKITSHFIIVTLSLVLFVYIPRCKTLSAGTAMIIFALYLLAYAVFATVYLLRCSKKRKAIDRNTEYKKVY